jgi:hypothetical protein
VAKRCTNGATTTRSMIQKRSSPLVAKRCTNGATTTSSMILRQPSPSVAKRCENGATTTNKPTKCHTVRKRRNSHSVRTYQCSVDHAGSRYCLHNKLCYRHSSCRQPARLIPPPRVLQVGMFSHHIYLRI